MYRPILRCSTILLASAAFTTTAQARNYLVVLVDDLGVDKVSTYQNDYPDSGVQQIAKMDTMDSLADAGIRFSRAWANPLCVPTRASVQAGAHPYRHGLGQQVKASESGINPGDWDMLGEVFSAGGHHTGFFGKWQIGNEDEQGHIGNPPVTPYTTPPHPVRSGWKDFDGSLAGVSQDGGYNNWSRLTWDDSTSSGTFGIETEHPTDILAASAATWIASRTGPWLAFISFQAPHAPNGGGVWSYADTNPDCYRSNDLECLATESCDDEALSVYQGLTECVDIKVGELLTGMDPATLDDTTVIFASDNGTPIQQLEGKFRVRNRGKSSPFESGVRVPFVVADGGTWRTGAAGVIAGPGRVSSATVHTTDIYATLIDDAFNQGPAHPDTRSFEGCFTDTSSDCGWGDQVGYAETYSHTGLGLLKNGVAAIRIGGDKAILRYRSNANCFMTAGYNVDTDPYESNRLPASQELIDAFAALHAAADGWGHNIPVCP